MCSMGVLQVKQQRKLLADDIVDDDDSFSLSDGFKSGTDSRGMWSTRGMQVSSPTKHDTR